MSTPEIRDLREEASKLSSKLAQLRALMEMTYCDARESFEGMSPKLRDDYMWACAAHCGECAELALQLDSGVHQLREGAVLPG